MKTVTKLAAAAALGIFCMSTSFAQTAIPEVNTQKNAHWKGKLKEMQKQSPEERANHQSEKMIKSLGLTDANVIAKVKALNAERAQQVQQLITTKEEKTTAIKREKFNAVKTIQNNYETKLKAIITPDQFTKYQTIKEEKKNELHKRRSDN